MWELDHKGCVPKNWCFQIMVLEKSLESPLDCKEIKPVNPKWNQPWILLKLKLQYFGHLMQRADSLEKTLMQSKIEDKRWGWQKMRWLDSITDSMDMNLSKFWEIVEDTGAWQATVAKSQTQLSDWTAIMTATRPSTDWMRPTYIRKGNLLYSKSTDLNVNLIQNTTSQKHPE